MPKRSKNSWRTSQKQAVESSIIGLLHKRCMHNARRRAGKPGGGPGSRPSQRPTAACGIQAIVSAWHCRGSAPGTA
eukprot:14345093-Heterocapsa_arctica.AAC.1